MYVCSLYLSFYVLIFADAFIYTCLVSTCHLCLGCSAFQCTCACGVKTQQGVALELKGTLATYICIYLLTYLPTSLFMCLFDV